MYTLSSSTVKQPMRFQFRKKKASNHGKQLDHGTFSSKQSALATDENDHQDRYMCNHQEVREGVNSAADASAVSVSSQSESKSESLVILLSIQSLSGLTITNRNVSPRSTKPGKRKAKKKDPPMSQSELRETLAKTTTVLVSVARECTDDGGHPMETYIPSLPLSENNLWKSKLTDSRVCSAYWPNAETDDDRSVLNKSTPATIQLNRKMQRVVYQREITAERASHFRHKRIDLNISLSRGTEMLRLGTASIAIAGNEEEEQMINAPIRVDDTSPRVRCWAANNKDGKNYFHDDTMHCYSLADNATLCLGVRVIAEEIIQHEERIIAQERVYIMESRESDSLDQKTPLIRLSDETDLMSTLSHGTSEVSFNSDPAALSFLGCCTGGTTFSLSSVLYFPDDEDHAKNHRKTTEATVTPIYMLSDMSESTAGLTGDTDEEGSEEATTDVSSVMFDE